MKNHLYVNTWNDYRQRFRLFIGVWCGGFICAVALVYLLSLAAAPEWLNLVIGTAWILGFSIAAMRLQLFKCPRCHNAFFKGAWYYWPFARNCVHCSLPKWHE